MKSKVLLFIVLLALSVSTSFAQRTVTSYILNAAVSGNVFSFEIWSQRTGATAIPVGITSYYFDLDNLGFNLITAPTIDTVNAKYTGPSDHSGDYDPMTVQFVGAGTKKLAVTINYTGANFGVGVLSNAAPNGERICIVKVTIADPTKTASLAWDQVNSSLTASTNQPVTNSYSGSSNILLPVEMTSMTAAAIGAKSAEINWRTATESNNIGFAVERRAEGGAWAQVAFVAGAGTSSSPKQYSYQDNKVGVGVFYYRLKQIDNTGAFKYSSSVQVDLGRVGPVFQMGNYPNPFNPSTEIQFSVPEDGFATLKVFNMLGQEVATLFSGVAKAGHYVSATFNASRFASGVYLSRLEYNGKSMVQRMLLAK